MQRVSFLTKSPLTTKTHFKRTKILPSSQTAKASKKVPKGVLRNMKNTFLTREWTVTLKTPSSPKMQSKTLKKTAIKNRPTSQLQSCAT